jgi:hypothetical protein
MPILALRCPLVTLSDIPFVARFIIAKLTPLTLSRFLGRLSSSDVNGVEPVEFEVFKCGLIGEKEVAALPDSSSDRLVKVDEGSMGCWGSCRK